MWAARERRFEELADVEDEAPASPSAVTAAEPEQVPTDVKRGRLGRIALLIAVVGVEGVWLVVLLYGAWRLIEYVA